MSPELFKYKPYSYKSDIWALGCVLYEICNLKHAFTAQTLNGLAVKILKGNHLPLNSNYSKTLRDTILSMLNISAKSRPKIDQLINTPNLKKKLVSYVISLYQKNSGEDDIYLETVKEQCKILKIDGLVQKYMNKKMAETGDIHLDESLSSSTSNLKAHKKIIEKEIKQEENEKENLNKKLQRLENLRNLRDKASHKERVLLDKELKREEENIRKEMEMQKIREENLKNQDKSKKRKQQEYNKSDNIKKIMGGGFDDASYDFDESQYDDSDFVGESRLGEIPEVDEELEEAKIEEIRNTLSQRVREKDEKIKGLRKTLKETTKKMNFEYSESGEESLDPNGHPHDYDDHDDHGNHHEDDLDAISGETPFSMSDIGDSEEDGFETELSLSKTFEDKIQGFKERCLLGIGDKKFEEAYRFIKMRKGDPAEQLRPHMTGKIFILFFRYIRQ